MEADFSGYATKAGLRCTDGRVIMPSAFAHNDGQKVPLVWQHKDDSPSNVIGHAKLEHRDDGVYAFAFLNDTEQALVTKQLILHGDINSLSIRANQLKEKRPYVLHGNIVEVSVVLYGANPGATIDNIYIQHADNSEEVVDGEAVIYTGLEIVHSGSNGETVDTKTEDDLTVKDVIDSMTDEQKNVLYYLVGSAIESKDDSENKETQHSGLEDSEESDTSEEEDIIHTQEDTQKMGTHNVFEKGAAGEAAPFELTHAQVAEIFATAQKLGSLKEAVLEHAGTYGIDNINLLFPDAQAVDDRPEWIKRRTEWVSGVLGGVRKTPFSRIKSLSADITLDTARAKGYITGNMKKEEFFGISRRITTPTTVYKKQKLDRDDVVDITSFDVVAWLRAEMRIMLDEEIARAILIGDGREIDDEDKVKEPANNVDGAGIRSIAHDADFYNEKVVVPANVSGDALLEAILRARPKFHGTGSPAMYTTEEIITDLLLIKDKMGRRLYNSIPELATACRVSTIIPVEVLEGQKTNEGDLLAILVNIQDYTVGTDRGGEVNNFDDFDIDYNQYKYLIEGRSAGALTRYKTAITISRASGTLVTPAVPTFNTGTDTITIPTVTGVVYTIDAATVTGDVVITEVTEVVAVPATGYYFPHNFDADWTFTP